MLESLHTKTALKKFTFRITLILFMVLFIVGLYPGVGGEGAQRSINSYNEKFDNGGFLLPLIYGYWPNLFGSWLFTLGLIQICLYTIGMYFILKNIKIFKLRALFYFIYFVGVFFVLQVVRDATSFSIFIFGIGVLSKIVTAKTKYTWILIILSYIIIFIGCFFKPILAPIMALIYVMFLKIYNTQKIGKVLTSLFLVSISFFPYAADKFVLAKFNLKPGYAEQQLFLFDAAKFYCWGHDASTVQIAKETLTPFLHKNSDYESICASLEPMAWDHLRTKLPEVLNSPALKIYTGADKAIVASLLNNWKNLILNNPFEWMQIKVIDSAQVLVMSNAFFIEPILKDESKSILHSAGNLLIKVLHLPIAILDKFRVFSLGMTFLCGLLLVISNGRVFRYQKSVDLVTLNFIIIIMLTLLFTTVLFIANPGRYTLPYVLFSYIYIISAFNSKENIQFNFDGFRKIKLKILKKNLIESKGSIKNLAFKYYLSKFD